MKSIFVEIHCPYCGAVSYNKSETLLIQGFDTNLETQLREDKFFRNRCPVCGKESMILHPLMYVDKKHHFVLLIKSEKDKKESDQEQYKGDTHLIKRYITQVEAIGEKIKILEEGIDDRCIEIMKVKLYLHFRRKEKEIQKIVYRDFDHQSRTFWFDVLFKDGDDVIGVESTTYEALKALFPRQPMEFSEINQNWALQWMKQQYHQ